MLNATSRHATRAMTTESVRPPPANPAPTPIENARPTPGPMVVTDWNSTPLVLTALWTSAWAGSAVLIHLLPLDVTEETKGRSVAECATALRQRNSSQAHAVCRFPPTLAKGLPRRPALRPPPSHGYPTRCTDDLSIRPQESR